MAEGQESLAPLFLCSHCLLLGLGALGTASNELLNWEFSESTVWSAAKSPLYLLNFYNPLKKTSL